VRTRNYLSVSLGFRVFCWHWQPVLHIRQYLQGRVVVEGKGRKRNEREKTRKTNASRLEMALCLRLDGKCGLVVAEEHPQLAQPLETSNGKRTTSPGGRKKNGEG